MNQARTTYQSDFTPFDWLQNNVTSDMNEFCCSENVDDCLKYISQEFSALGYPSIYSDSDCPNAVNCDIVNFLNATFELLRSNTEHIQNKDILESRNERLLSDLKALSKKNGLLKNDLEQNERKLTSALERERQLKEKNDQLLQALKAEKEETKKLTLQLRQQKVAYQHEIRKHENNMNHIKAKLNQLLSDKNPNKKIANISTSQTLPRSTGQRGRWKTGTTATTAIENMYNTVISTYETRSKDLYQELNSFRQFMQSVLMKILEVISALQDEQDGKFSSTSKDFVLNEIKKESKDLQSFEDKFQYLLSVLMETASKKSNTVNENLKNEIAKLQLKLSGYEKCAEKNLNSPVVSATTGVNETDGQILSKENVARSPDEEFIRKEKMKLEAQKLELAKALENIEKEKADISAQKIAVLRLAIQQKAQPSSWHQTPKTSPSISVITSQNGSTKISNINELKSSLSTPDHFWDLDRSFSPQWKSDVQVVDGVFPSKSDSVLLKQNQNVSSAHLAYCSSPLTPEVQFPNSDLPSWAINNSKLESVIIDDTQNTALEVSKTVSTAEVELLNESSVEELSLLRLKAAVEDIESKRANIS